MSVGARHPAGGRWVSRVWWGIALLLVTGAAFGLRIAVVLLSAGGPYGNFGYDAGVYYAAADALIHGRVPYGEFVLLHPPGLMLTLTPFALVGTLTSDHTGFVVANTAFAALSAVNAALVTIICRRLRMPAGAALLGGLFYAVWFGAITAEFSLRLEPLGNFAFLCALLALAGRDGRHRRRTLLLAGFALGAAMSVKIWWLASVAVVVLWYVGHARTRRQAGPLTLGVAAALLVLDLPFFVLAPAAMWRMVVLDQLGRNPNRTSLIARLRLLTSLRETLPHLTGPRLVAVLGVLGAGAILLGIAAWRHAACRMLVVVAAVQMAVLMLAPSYFPFYSDYVATGISFVVAGAAATAHPPGRLRGSRFAARLGPAGAVAAVAVAAAICVGMVFYRPIRSITPFPSEAMADDAAHLHCVMSDSPMALIALDDLSRDLADRCQNWVDVTGRTYGIDAPPADHLVSRVHNEKWQRDLRRYLLSGNAVILVRGDTGVGPGIKDTIRRLPVLVDSGGHVLRLVTADRNGSRVTRRSA